MGRPGDPADAAAPPQPASGSHAAPLSLPSGGMLRPGRSSRDPRLKPPPRPPAPEAQHAAQHAGAEPDEQGPSLGEEDESGNQQEGHSRVEEEEARRCSHCSCTWTSGAWCRHPATRARLCNACWQFNRSHAGQLPENDLLERRALVRHNAPRQCSECGSSDPSSGRSYAKVHWHRHPANPAQWLCMLCGPRIQRLLRSQMQLNATGQQAAPIVASGGQQHDSHAVLLAPNSTQVQQPQDAPQPCSAAALLSGPGAMGEELEAVTEDELHRNTKQSEGAQPRSSKRQRKGTPASVREQRDQRNYEHAAPIAFTAQEAHQQEQRASIHVQQQPQCQPAPQLWLAEVPTALLPAGEQLAPQPAVQQPSVYDLLMDDLHQPAAVAAGLTGNMAAEILGLSPVQAEMVRCRLMRWFAGCDCCTYSYRPSAAPNSRKSMSLSIFRWEALAIQSMQQYRRGPPEAAKPSRRCCPVTACPDLAGIQAAVAIPA
jgi:hypothetical protein